MENQRTMNNQGMKYKNGKEQIIQQGFKSEREGFRGILGNNIYMDNVIRRDTANTKTNTYAFNDNLAQYGSQYQTLKEETKSYIDNSRMVQSVNKNYNLFINKSQGMADIKESNQYGCVTRESISNLTLASGFAAAYPENFTNYADANNACKLWAADSDKTVYAVTKDETGKYQCSTGSDLASNIKPSMKAGTVYTVLAGDATAVQGGLFANGQIGVWAGTIIASNNQWNISKMKKPMRIKKFNNNTYAANETPFALSLHGWWGDSNPPPLTSPNSRIWGVNMFPNSIAWWMGNSREENTPTATRNADGTKSYFYYTFNAPSAMPVFLYAVLPSAIGLKINGVNKGMTPVNGSWFWGATLSMNLPAGQNVFELSSYTGLPNSGFVFYAATADKNTVLFKSGDPDWGVTTTPVPDFNLIANATIDQANPRGLKTLNPAPTGYDKCDVLMGGGINKASISASFGRNCSDKTHGPLNIRYVKVIANARGDYLQIDQIVVNALLNGVITNVANRGTVSQSNFWPGTSPLSPIDGTLTTRPILGGYYSESPSSTNYWQLDLGQDYPVTEIVYYNRGDCCQNRANGMTINLKANNGTVYSPIIMTDAARQTFNISPMTIVAVTN
jgi:hypothetical protein